MAERPNLRSIAVIRRMSGARDGNLPKLAILRRSRRLGGARLLAAIASRAGLAGLVARHSLSFGQSLRPLHPRRYMTGAAMRMDLRRRPRPRPEAQQIRYSWPRSRQFTLDDFDGQAVEVPAFAEPSFDDAPPSLLAEFDIARVPVDQATESFDDGQEAQTPAEVMLSRHEAFLGMPLLVDRVATGGRPFQARAALPMPFVAPSASEVQVTSSARAPESAASIDVGLEPAIASLPAGRALSGLLDSMQESPSQSPATGGGLPALRRLASFKPLSPSAASAGFASSVASRRAAFGAAPADQSSPAARFAPVTLALHRTSSMARVLAQRATASFDHPATQQLVWPTAAVERGATSVGVPSIQAGVGGDPVPQSPGSDWVLDISRRPGGSSVDWPGETTLVGSTAQYTTASGDRGFEGQIDGGQVAQRRAASFASSIGKWEAIADAIEPISQEALASDFLPVGDLGQQELSQAPARHYVGEHPRGRAVVPARPAVFPSLSRSWNASVLDPFTEHEYSKDGGRLPWSNGQTSRRAALGFPSGVNRMHATATNLVLRRAPGVSIRSFLGAETVRSLYWPASPARDVPHTSATESPAMTFGRQTESRAVEPPFVGGPLPVPTVHARRAMRVEPIRATLTAQYPTATLAAPPPGAVGASWPTQGVSKSAAGGAAMPAGQGADVDTTPVLPHLLPAFAARRAEHATWGESLAVGGPPPLLAVEPSGASGVNVARPNAGVLHRLAFADAWRRSADGHSHATSDRTAAPGAAFPLPLGSAGIGSAPRARPGSRHTVAGAVSDATWPSAVGSPGIPAPVDGVGGPFGSTGWAGRWDRAELSLTSTMRRYQDAVAGGGLPTTSDRLFGYGSGAVVPPVFAGGWPIMASDQMVLQRRTPMSGRGWPAEGAAAGQSSVHSGVRWGQNGAAATSAASSAMPTSTPVSWATSPSLPIARNWRRSIATPPPMTAAEQAFARWPVFRSAMSDLTEPNTAQRSVAAEAMAASEGQALPPLVRRSMEHLFRMDLAPVRVHSGTQATRATGAVAARAMAHGTDIYLPGGVADSPGSVDMPLLAHELTHVAHHMGHRPPAAMPSLTLARRSAPEEHDADHIERMVAGAMQDSAPVQRESAALLTLARRPAPITIMRVEEDNAPAAPPPASGSASATAEGGEKPRDKTEENKQTDKLAEEIFRRLERRLIVARERGGHRW